MAKNILSYLLAFLIILGININVDSSFTLIKSFSGNDIIYIFILIALAEFIKVNWKIKNKRITVISLALAIIIGLIEVVGYNLYSMESIRELYISGIIILKNILKFSGISLLSYFVIVFLIAKINNYKTNNLTFVINKKTFFFIWLVLFLSYLPIYFKFYPGVLSQDSINQISQVFNVIPLRDAHPVFSTLILKLVIGIGEKFTSITHAVAIYIILQMLILCAILAYFIYYMLKRHLNNYIILITFLFIILGQIIALYSITMWKDILFGGFFLLFIINLFQIIKEKDYFKKKTNTIVFILISSFIMFQRHNGFYVILLSFPLLMIFIKEYRKILFAIYILLISIYGLYRGPVFDLLNVLEGSSAEVLSTPMQQFARIDKYENLPYNDKEKINKWFLSKNIGREYLYWISDPVKVQFNTEYFDTHKKEFIKDWSSLFFKYPLTFTESYLLGSLGYWYPSVDYWVYATGIFTNDFGLDNSYYISFNNVSIRSIPVLSMLYSIGFSFITLIFSLVIFIYKKNYKALIPYIPIFILWLTCTVSPVYGEYRYIWPMIISTPLFLALALEKYPLED